MVCLISETRHTNSSCYPNTGANNKLHSLWVSDEEEEEHLPAFCCQMVRCEQLVKYFQIYIAILQFARIITSHTHAQTHTHTCTNTHMHAHTETHTQPHHTTCRHAPCTHRGKKRNDKQNGLLPCFFIIISIIMPIGHFSEGSWDKNSCLSVARNLPALHCSPFNVPSEAKGLIEEKILVFL